MIKYLVFSSTYYYPGGGMKDCIGKAIDIEEVLEIIEDKASDTVPDEMYQVYDIEHDLTYSYDDELELEDNEDGIPEATKESIDNFLKKIRADIE